jgi:hypothetical protein
MEVFENDQPYELSAGEEMEASGGRTGREGEEERLRVADEAVGEREVRCLSLFLISALMSES